MSAVDDLSAALFGDPPSDSFKPDRNGVLVAFTELYQVANASINGITQSNTAAALVAPSEGQPTVAIVTADPTPANNGYWIYPTGGPWTVASVLNAALKGAPGTNGLLSAATKAQLDAGTDNTVSVTPADLTYLGYRDTFDQLFVKTGIDRNAALTTATYGDNTVTANTINNAIIRGNPPLSAPGTVSNASVNLFGAGTGLITVAVPSGASMVVDAVYPVTVSAAGVLNLNTVTTGLVGRKLPKGAVVAYQFLTGNAYLKANLSAGTSYTITDAAHSPPQVGDTVSLTSFTGTLGLQITIESYDEALEPRLSSVEDTVSDLSSNDVGQRLLLGQDPNISTQVLGTTTPNAQTVSTAHIFASATPTTRAGIPKQIGFRLSAAGNGQLVFIIPDGNGGYTTKAYPVTSPTATPTFTAGIDFPMLWLPEGTYWTYYTILGGILRYDPAYTPAIGYAQFDGYAGVSGAAVTLTSISAPNTVAASMTLSYIDDNIEDRLEALESGASGGSSKSWLWASASEIVHMIIYGQSLAAGHGTTVNNATPLSYALRYGTGVRSQDYDGNWGTGGSAGHTAFIGLYEQISATLAGYAETPASGMAKMLAQLYLADGIDVTTWNRKWLFSDPSKGATALSGLSPGQPPFQQLKDDITFAPALAASYGKPTYAPQLMALEQGQQDYVNGTSAATWANELETIRLAAQIQARTTATQPDLILPIVLSQVSSHLNYGVAYPNIALQQAALHANNYYCVACPEYHLPADAAAAPHLTASGSEWMGAYWAVAFYNWIIKGEKPSAMQPISVHRSGNNLIATYPVATGKKLVIDTTQVSAQTNYGFTCVDASGSAVTLSNARLVGNNQIAFTCASTPAAGWKLRNGFLDSTGANIFGKSNLRDNAGDTLVYAGSTTLGNVPMHNWALCSETTVI